MGNLPLEVLALVYLSLGILSVNVSGFWCAWCFAVS